MFNILSMLIIDLKVSVNNNLKRISSRFGYGTSFIHYYIVACHDWFYCRFQFFPQIKYQTRNFVHAALFLIPYANMHPHLTWFRFSLGLNFNPTNQPTTDERNDDLNDRRPDGGNETT